MAAAGAGLVAGAGAVAGAVVAPAASGGAGAVVAPAAAGGAGAVVAPTAAGVAGEVVATTSGEVVAPVLDLEDADRAAREAAYDYIDSLYEQQEHYDPVEYETDDDIIKDNFESYVQRQLKRFQSRELKITKKGRYIAPFHPCKVKDGALASLEYHAMDTRHSPREEMQGMADHQALARFMLGDRLPRSGRILKKRRM